MEHTKISFFKTKDNLHTLTKGLDSLIRKIENKEIIIKTAEKVQISLLCPQITYYWNICQSHISDTSSYRMLNTGSRYRTFNDTDPSNIVQQRVTQIADKYKPMLTLTEYNYLIKKTKNVKSFHASKIT